MPVTIIVQKKMHTIKCVDHNGVTMTSIVRLASFTGSVYTFLRMIEEAAYALDAMKKIAGYNSIHVTC